MYNTFKLSEFEKFVKGYLPSNTQNINSTESNDNNVCDVKECNENYKIDDENINNLQNKNYSKISFDFINKLINIFNNDIKPKILSLLENTESYNKIKEINIKSVTFFNFKSLLDSYKNYKDTLRDGLCKINTSYNNKVLFSIVISRILCKIKNCLKDNDKFIKIKKIIEDNINDLYNKCNISN